MGGMSGTDQEVLAILEQHIRENPGVLSVSFGGTTTTYSSLKDLLDARDRLQNRVNEQAGRRPLFREITMGGV